MVKKILLTLISLLILISGCLEELTTTKIKEFDSQRYENITHVEGLTFITDKDSYKVGEKVNVKLLNQLEDPVDISYPIRMNSPLAVTDGEQQLVLTKPACHQLPAVETIWIKPNETKSIGSWDQMHYTDCTKNNCPEEPSTCSYKQVPTGKYLISTSYQVKGKSGKIGKIITIL